MYQDFNEVIRDTKRRLLEEGKPVEVGHWQGMNVKGKPELVSFEVLNHSFTCSVAPDLETLKTEIEPNLPWADDHFQERVGGRPLNPGEQYKNWPFYKVGSERDKEFRARGGQFTHTYMERIWPKMANGGKSVFRNKPHKGIRYEYGDLDDLVDLLEREPQTRQAFLPIWFPEDTGAIHQGRVPCTIGYQFMCRDDKLHIFYPLRACDYLRHFRDDIYLACRLLLWVLDELRKRDDKWKKVQPGNLTMQIWSLHVFVGDVPILRYREDL